MPQSSRFAVFGIGRYGTQIALALAAKGAEVFTFDSNSVRSENIKDAAVVAIGENFEATVLTALNLLDLGVPRVIVRSNGEHQQRILSSLGVKEILNPESEVASVISERLIHPNIGGFLELPDDYEIAEIHAPKNCIGRPLGSIDLTNRYELRLITIRRVFETDEEGLSTTEHIIGVPKPEMEIEATDTLVVFGTLTAVKRFLEINS
jgi:trk system potassium uptake protein